MTEREKFEHEQAKKALKTIADFFYQTGIPGIERPDDKGWYYLSKSVADKFKREYAKLLFR